MKFCGPVGGEIGSEGGLHKVTGSKYVARISYAANFFFFFFTAIAAAIKFT